MNDEQEPYDNVLALVSAFIMALAAIIAVVALLSWATGPLP